MGIYNNKIYLLNDGTLRCSDSWTSSTSCTLRAILGGYSNYFYGVNDQKKIMVATGDPMTASFSNDDMEDMTYYATGDSLPYCDFNLITTDLITDPTVGRVVLLANKQYDAKEIISPNKDLAVIWSKIIDSEMSQKWYFLNPAWENHYKVLPRMAYLSATSFGDGIIAIGGNLGGNALGQDFRVLPRLQLLPTIHTSISLTAATARYGEVEGCRTS